MVHLVNEILHLHNHSWRDIKLNQLSELYISMMIKTLGLSLIGIFVPIYLYQLGYSLTVIASFFVINYAFRIGWDFVTAWLVGWFGPKHIMILSHLFLISTLGLLLALEYQAIPIWIIAISNAFAYSLFFLAYHIEFSKLQTQKRGGHQLSVMYQVGKLASAVGPIVGGVVAYLYGFSAVIIVSIMLILISAVPLLMSPEPVRLHQRITFKGFPFKSAFPGYCSNFGTSFNQMASMLYWPLYVGLFVFGSNLFVSVGLITSVGLVASFVAARLYGKLIDERHSSRLFKAGAGGSALVNMGRIAVTSSPFAYFLNLVSDPLNLAYGMTLTKQMYQEASSYEGYRNIYIAALITSANIGRTISWSIVLVSALLFSDQLALQIGFLIAALATPLMFTHKYRELK